MDKKEFIDMWAPLAMEHQIRYGIPASVTLAQAAIESGWGSSELYTKQNACFGVKLGNKKGQEGKDYVVREDDRNRVTWGFPGDLTKQFKIRTKVLNIALWQIH